MTRRYTSGRIAVVVSILVLLPQAAHSDESEQQMGVAREMVRVLEAYAVYKMGQYDLAFERYQALAEAGSHQGMYNLANMYAAGQGVEQSDSMAFEWYLKAAQAGDRLSMSEVAKAYAGGIGTEPDPVKADYWRARAADAP
ncbi:MAG: tetratricopeptide repeat protein [Marinobacter sp.]|uniref:tetratricopeptide repeat protein n=1 Tax=Marinobacter sp. TaxID=50741 RepID=UPI0035679C97